MINSTALSHNFLKERLQFSWYDYCLFTFMLSVSIIIGIYFGCFGKKQNTTNEYLLGGKAMKVFPIAMSLVASNISSITILSIPADVYKFGCTIALISVSHVIACLITAYITMPVLYPLEITSIYEYLMLRFDNKIRIIASVLYNINTILYLPIVIYGPALALSQVAPVNLHFVNPIICAICIFYTTIGGLKAVVWTDTLQFTAMLGAIIAVLYIGLTAVGGLNVVINRALIGERLYVDFDIDPMKRDTFWAIAIGWTIFFIPNLAINQGTVQKFLSLPKLSDIKKTLIIYAIGVIFCKGASILTGLIMYARYYDCDPFTTKQVQKDDQLLPYYIMDVASKIPGLPGLFIAGVFCASLSTLSAHMNSLSGTIYEDFISRFMPKNITQRHISNILKLIVVVIGIFSIVLVFVIEKLGGLFALSITLSGISGGPLLGLFALGMLFPSANSKGAFVGCIVSLAFISFMVIGSQLYKFRGILNFVPKPLSAEGCIANASISETNERPALANDVFLLFKITHYYNTFIGASVLLLVALPVSWMTKIEKRVDRKLIAPLMRWVIPTIFEKEPHNINKEEIVKLNEE